MRPIKDVPLYYRGLRFDLRTFLPNQITRLLDVGCGAGAFGHLMKSDFGCEVWGIEIVEDMASLAKERLDRVETGDCMKILPTLPGSHFDVVVFSDVLEHLVNPVAALSEVKRVLTPDGVLVASVPNIRYWPAFKRLLLHGDFPWEDQGIFDATHLRFFTEKSFRRMFESNGWQVAQLGGVNAYVSFGMRAANVLAMRKLRDMKWMQFVAVAKPSDGNDH